MTALDEDLNTPLAISRLHELAVDLNKARRRRDKARLKGALLAGGEVLGLLGQDPEAWFKGPATGAAIDEAEIAEMVTARSTARADGDFVKADQIRHDLRIKYKIILEDRPDGTTDWRRAG